MGKGLTIEEFLDKVRKAETPEQRLERTLRFNESMRKIEEEENRAATCTVCKVNTRLYSHTFDCRWRGL